MSPPITGRPNVHASVNTPPKLSWVDGTHRTSQAASASVFSRRSTDPEPQDPAVGAGEGPLGATDGRTREHERRVGHVPPHVRRGREHDREALVREVLPEEEHDGARQAVATAGRPYGVGVGRQHGPDAGDGHAVGRRPSWMSVSFSASVRAMSRSARR